MNDAMLSEAHQTANAGHARLSTGPTDQGKARASQNARAHGLTAAHPIPELLLMFAERAQNVEQSILPALAEAKIVVSARFTDSSIAYQGGEHALAWETVLAVDRIACHGLVPA